MAATSSQCMKQATTYHRPMSDVQITDEMHQAHHEFLHECIPLIKEYLEERRQSRARWDRIRESALGSAVTIIIGGLFAFMAWVGRLILEHFKSS